MNDKREILSEIIDRIDIYSDKIEISYVTGPKDISRIDIDDILEKETSAPKGNQWARVRPLSQKVEPRL